MAKGRHSAKARAKDARARDRAEIRAMASGQSSEPHAPQAAYTNLTSRPVRSRSARARVSASSGGSGRGSRRRTWLVVASVLLVVVVVVGFLGYRWVDAQVHPSGPPGRQVILTVPTGATGSSVADLLASKGVLGHPLVFRLYMKVHPVKTIQPGPYAFHSNEAYAAIESTLKAGPDQSLLCTRLIVPDGLTLGQIAARVGQLKGHTASGFAAAVSGGHVTTPYKPASGNLEGLLFPDTYCVSPGESDLRIAQQMADRFDDIASSVNLDAGAAAVGMSPYQVVIVASIVEREASVPSDMGKVAQVVYNRLKAGMKLQLDTTVDYALALAGQPVPSEITYAQEKTPSPYNTYLNSGLPPGPISAPSEAALQAALHPTPGDWLYFVVVDRHGNEAFATTLSGQNANIALAHRNGL